MEIFYFHVISNLFSTAGRFVGRVVKEIKKRIKRRGKNMFGWRSLEAESKFLS